MLKNLFYVVLFTVIGWGGYLISYPSNTPPDLFYDGVFLEKITNHIDQLTQHPRAIGDYHHDMAERYLTRQLNQAGLTVRKQSAVVYNPKSRTGAPVKNLIASYAGTRQDAPTLMLMAHYDAAEFSSTGAADDASGVAVILEVVHAYLQSGQRPENNLLVLLTDAEEPGLLGAQAFIKEQLMNHDIKLIINLEARGSGGPVMMWPETVAGNRGLISAFAEAEVPLPVTTSLHYEIYRMLPNDTDLTPFNQQAGIDGFNLAFIDNHFNYHTRQDTLENLSLNTLAHQTIQLKSLLLYFADADLTQLTSNQSLVYFNLPGMGLISYPSELNWLIWLLTAGLMILSLRNSKQTTETQTGWLRMLSVVVLIPAATYLLILLVLFIISWLFPAHADILQGFPYQGHAIMFGTLLLALMLGFAGWGAGQQDPRHITRLLQLVWLIITGLLIVWMPGSGFLLWPLLLSVAGTLLWQRWPQWGEQLLLLGLMLTAWLLGAVLINLPIALGVAMLPATACLLVLILGLFTPAMAAFGNKTRVVISCAIPVLLMAVALYHNRSFTSNTAHPTSLTYLYDSERQAGYWLSYDAVDNGWNDYLFTEPASQQQLDSFRSEHKKPLRRLQLMNDPVRIEPISTQVKKPLMQSGNTRIQVELKARRNSKLIEIYSQQDMTLNSIRFQDRTHRFTEPRLFSAGDRLVRYYLGSDKTLRLELELVETDSLDWLIQTHSVDLLEDARFALKPRPADQMPKPFISTDNIIVEQSLTFGLDE
jgi:hypothetical protein